MDKAWEWVKFIIKCMLLIFTALMSFCIVVSMTVVPAEEGWPLNELPIWFAIFGAMAIGFGFGCWKIFLSIRGDIPALFERSSFSSKSAAQKSTDEEKKKWWHGAPDYVFGNSASVDKKHVNLKDYHDFLSHHNKLFTVAHFRNTAGTKEWGTDLYVDKIVGWSTYLVTTFADGMPVDLNEQTLQSSAPAEMVELSIQKISRAQMRALLEKAVQVSPTKKSLQLALQNHASFEGRIGLKEGFEFASQCKNMVFLEGEHIRDEWERVTEVYQQKSTEQLYLMSHNGTIGFFFYAKDVEEFETPYGRYAYQTVILHPINHEDLRSLLIRGEKRAAAEETVAEEVTAPTKQQSAKFESDETDGKMVKEKISLKRSWAERAEKFSPGSAQKIDAYFDFTENKKWLFSFDYRRNSSMFYTEHGTDIWIDKTNGQPYLAKTTGSEVPAGEGCLCDQELSILDGAPRAISYEEMLMLAEEKYPGLAQEYAGINETNWRDYTEAYHHYNEKLRKTQLDSAQRHE